MSAHIVPRVIYFRIFAVLIFFTAVTTAVAYVDFGYLNTVIAVSIAVVKALFVILFFMHVRYSKNLVKVFVAGGFLWLIVMFAFLLSDYGARHWQDVPDGWTQTLKEPLPAVDAGPRSPAHP